MNLHVGISPAFPRRADLTVTVDRAPDAPSEDGSTAVILLDDRNVRMPGTADTAGKSFTFPGIPAGDYRVIAKANGCATSEDEITTGSEAVATKRITLLRGIQTRIRIASEGDWCRRSPIEVTIRASDGHVSRVLRFERWTDCALEAYERLAPGRYDIEVTSEGRTGSYGPFLIDSSHPELTILLAS